jgi:predicted transcriptional regulator of viral defense system
VNIAGKNVFISDKEKTIADCLDHPEYCGDITEAAKALWNARKDIDFKKLIDYAVKMNNRAILKRLGYLIQKLKIKIPQDIEIEIKNNISKGYAVLNTAKEKKGKHDSKWMLLINISDKDLLEFKVIY